MLIYIIATVGLAMVAFFAGHSVGYEAGKTSGVQEQIRLCSAGGHSGSYRQATTEEQCTQ